jgi:hypothetical protein
MKPQCVFAPLDVAVCCDGCGLRPVLGLLPPEGDWLGACDLCGAPACDCDDCLFSVPVEDN